jgi:hypothetical protein
VTTEEIPKNNRKSRPVSVALTPAEREFIKAYGDGNVSRGIRAMVRVCKHLSEEAVKRRARARYGETSSAAWENMPPATPPKGALEATLSHGKRQREAYATKRTHMAALAGGPELCTQAELDEALAGATSHQETDNE